MIELAPHNRNLLAPLFSEHKQLRTVIDAILQNGMGTAVTDDPIHPQIAKLTLGFDFLGGDATHPAAIDLVSGLVGETAVLPNKQWRDLIFATHGERVKIHNRFTSDGAQLNIEQLRPFAASHPVEFTIKQIDLLLAQQIRTDVTPDLIDNFGSVEAFIKRGFGFCAVHTTTGRIACGASTFAACSHNIEIEIDTHPHYRQLGLATAVSAHLIIYCLQNNIHPHWDAHNRTSARLAQRLGYQMRGAYETYRITHTA